LFARRKLSSFITALPSLGYWDTKKEAEQVFCFF